MYTLSLRTMNPSRERGLLLDFCSWLQFVYGLIVPSSERYLPMSIPLGLTIGGFLPHTVSQSRTRKPVFHAMGLPCHYRRRDALSYVLCSHVTPRATMAESV